MHWLDLKLGGRMLVKYPGLTIVGGLAMTFAIWVGIVIFQMATLFFYPTLPLSAGDRMVEIRSRDLAANVREEQILHDFLAWRESLQSVTELGAWRSANRNLIVAGGDARPVLVAEMSVTGFRIADGVPLMGRVLTTADEQPAAPSVAVIGYDVWRTRFGSDPSVVGRTVQFGNEYTTIVGVMREGFAFPVSHDVWVPLRTSLLDQTPRSGPAISVFGLLAPGETLETAQAELTALGRRAAIDRPATHRHLEPRVSPYVMMLTADSEAERTVAYSIYFFVLLVLVLICGNVGLLLFARAATRETDLIVRMALGASRSRIVAQIFAEALVLGGVAALVGLAAAGVSLRAWGLPFLEANMGRLPFWFDLTLSPATVLFTLAMTVVAAAVAGVMPALKITRRMGDHLKRTTAGAGGVQFGGVWSVVIVAQIAATVAFPGLVYWEQFQLRRVRNFDTGFAADRYLTVRVEKDQGARFSSALDEVRRRLAAQPGVAGVTFAERLPTMAHPQVRIEMGYDAGVASGFNPTPLREATIAAIDPSYFDVLQAPMLAGRAFTAADLGPGPNVAIVDQAFVEEVLQGRNPIGQRVRFVGNGTDGAPNRNPWYEIVGLVKELGVGAPTRRGRAAGFYIPGTPGTFDEVYMMVHARSGDPMALGPQVREVAAAVDPLLRLVEFQRAHEINSGIAWVLGVWLRVTVLMSAVAIVLSLAGIYAVLSFAVSRRTREIGLRVALGASRPRVIATIFRRPLLQVGLGVLAGTSIIFTVATLAKETEFPGSESGLSLEALAMLLAHAIVMLGVCLLACIVPTRRALGVEPTVALRTE